MNATMINNREFVETLHAMESNINLRLLVSATKFYGKEYDQEIVPYPPADLDNIY